MDVVTKPFFESKIMVSATVIFIASLVQVFTSYFIPMNVLNEFSDVVFPAFEQKTLLAAISAFASGYAIIKRGLLKSDEIKVVWYKSQILWAAIVIFVSQVAFFFTGVQIPEEITTGLVGIIIELVTTGDVIAFVVGLINIGMAIWRIFSTTTELEFNNIKPLQPSLTLYDKKAA